jgi:hypothetical protein
MQAAICRPDRLNRLDHLGHQHHGRDLAAMAAGLGALHDENIDAGRDLAERMLLGTDQCRHRHAVLLAHLDHRLRRHAQRIGDQPDRMPERRIEDFQRTLRVERLRLVVGDISRRQFNAVFLEEVAGEGAMFVRNPRLQAFPGDILLACGRNVLGDQHVEPIGLAVDVIVDPFQFLLDGFGRVRGGAEHAETSGAADGGNHVAAMAESQQGKFYTQHVADRRFHGCVLPAAAFWCCSSCLNGEFSDDASAPWAVMPSGSNDLIPARAQLRSSLEERRLRRVSKDVPHGGLMVRDGARAPPHHEGRTFRVAKYPGREGGIFSLALSHRG